ncbi:MAG TPA: hypothetical protein GXX15_06890 [Clostridia bacterium]|nr:hypothetical protein [Clostridia bacterium]
MEYIDKYLIEMAKMYNKQPTRYYRSLFEFKNLLKGRIIPWGSFTYQTYLVKKGGLLKGYVVLRIVHDNPRKGYIIEYSGDANIIYESLKKIAAANSLEYVRVPCTFNDDMLGVVEEKGKSYEKINLLGTLKVLNFQQLMEKLKPYFLQYVEKDIVENIKFIEEEDNYIIEIKNEILKIDDVVKLTKLVFGDKGFGMEVHDISPNLKEFISTVFPLPFVWPGNLNFQ